MPNLPELTLANMANGGALELFEGELQRVLENIEDVNTDPSAKRTITLTVTIVPDKNREAASLDAKCVSKLAPRQSATSEIFMGRRKGKRVAVESDPKQYGLYDGDAPEVRKVKDA